MRNRNSKGQFINQGALVKGNCLLCSKEFTDYRSNKRQFCSRVCQNTWLARNKNGMKDKILTNTPSYSSVHKWLYRRLTKQNICARCKKSAIQTDWASLSHSFNRDINDYIELCRSCHTLFDHGRIQV